MQRTAYAFAQFSALPQISLQATMLSQATKDQTDLKERTKGKLYPKASLSQCH
jgi:hypothetical protein